MISAPRLWIESAAEIEREYYLSVTLDRGAKKPLLMFTTQGGVEIEEVAANDPDALVRLHTPLPPAKIGGPDEPGLVARLRPDVPVRRGAGGGGIRR